MLIPRVVRVKRAIVDRLRTLTPASGAQYAIDVREIGEIVGNPQSGGDNLVEVDVEFAGYEESDDQPIQHSYPWMVFTISTVVKGRLQNEDNPVDEVAMIVDADIWTALMEEAWFQGTAECANAKLHSFDIVGQLEKGYYAFARSFAFLVPFDLDQPFSR